MSGGEPSSLGLALVGSLYAVVVGFGVARAGFDDPIGDPILSVMEVLTILAALVVVVLMASICVQASRERRVFGVLALSFAVVMAGLTCAVHFVALTAGRQTGFAALEWPSTLYAVELLAWDVFLGLSLLSAAWVFPIHPRTGPPRGLGRPRSRSRTITRSCRPA